MGNKTSMITNEMLPEKFARLGSAIRRFPAESSNGKIGGKKSIKDIKRDILSKFRTTKSDSYVLSCLWLHKEYLKDLNRLEKEFYETAVNELVGIGLLEYKQDAFSCLRLTPKGESLLFCD
ncbi:MAG: hypothetical protein V2B19_31160 [Pseudomonadota bacterium]